MTSEIGDNNQIDQQFTQQNKDCEINACSDFGVTRSTIGSTLNGDILSIAENSRNIQFTSVADSNNDNRISHSDIELNGPCHQSCANNLFEGSRIGTIQGGTIFEFGSNNNNTQNIATSNSANLNIITRTKTQDNNCRQIGIGDCFTSIFEGLNAGGIERGTIFDFGNNNSNTQSIIREDSVKSNSMNSETDQISRLCDAHYECSNDNINGISVGIISASNINEGGNNNTNVQKIIQSDSLKENSVTNTQTQTNSFCRQGINDFDSVCGNVIRRDTAIGNVVTYGLQDCGDNNKYVKNLLQNGSNNGNKLGSTSSQDNNNCENETNCLNFYNTKSSIGGNPSFSFSDVLNGGDNNSISQIGMDLNSDNNNNVGQMATQENANCGDITDCENHINFQANIGNSLIGDIENSGDNNIISNSQVTVNSNNHNKITQEAEQKNQGCSISSCQNTGIATTDVGKIETPRIVNDQSNVSINLTKVSTDTNNNNLVLQKLDQKNLCRDELIAETTLI